VGPEVIDKIQTTHYTAQIDSSKAKARVGKDAKELLNESGAKLPKKIPADIWVDSAGLPIRISMAYTIKVQGQKVTTELTAQFSRYGEPVHVSIPKSSDVTPLPSLDAYLAALKGDQ